MHPEGQAVPPTGPRCHAVRSHRTGMRNVVRGALVAAGKRGARRSRRGLPCLRVPASPGQRGRGCPRSPGGGSATPQAAGSPGWRHVALAGQAWGDGGEGGGGACPQGGRTVQPQNRWCCGWRSTLGPKGATARRSSNRELDWKGDERVWSAVCPHLDRVDKLPAPAQRQRLASQHQHGSSTVISAS